MTGTHANKVCISFVLVQNFLNQDRIREVSGLLRTIVKCILRFRFLEISEKFQRI